MTAELVRFRIDFGSGPIDITNRVTQAGGTRGRKAATAATDPGGASVFLHDPDRDFDPLNGGARTVDGSTFTHNDLGSGVLIEHDIRETTSDPWVTRWAGEVVDWVPSTWAGDGSDTNPMVELQCIGAVGELNRELPPLVNDLLVERLAQASAGVFYALNSTNGTTGGRVEDQSGRGAHGIAYPTAGGSPGYLSISPGTINLLASSEIIAPLPADIERTSPQGWFAAFVITLDSYTPPNENVYFPICSEGIDDPDRDGMYISLRDRWLGTGNPRDMFLQTNLYVNNSSVLFDLINVGLPSEWINKPRLVLVGHDTTEYWQAVVSLDGSTFDGVTSKVDTTTHPTLGSNANPPPPNISSDSRLFRIGRMYDTTLSVSAPDQNDGFDGQLDLAVIGYGAASTDWATRAAAAALDLGMAAMNSADRVAQVRDLAGFPSARWVSNITSGITYNEAAPVGYGSGLERMAQLVDNEQGRLVQQNGGLVRFDDFAACKAQAASSGSEPTYTDQGDPDVVLGYTDAVLTAGRSTLINRATVRLASGFTYTAENATSVLVHGPRPQTFDLILVDEDDAEAFADAIVSRFATQRPHVTSVDINPKRNPSVWWPELVARDIGDRVIVERQPAGVGTVASVPSVIEGERWTWSASSDEYLVSFYLSPAANYDGVTYP